MRPNLIFEEREYLVSEYFRSKGLAHLPKHLLQTSPRLIVNILSDEIKAGMAEGNKIPFPETPDFSVIHDAGIRVASEYMTFIDIREDTKYSFWKILNSPPHDNAENLKCKAFRRGKRIQRKERRYIPKGHSGGTYWIASSQLMIKN